MGQQTNIALNNLSNAIDNLQANFPQPGADPDDGSTAAAIAEQTQRIVDLTPVSAPASPSETPQAVAPQMRAQSGLGAPIPAETPAPAPDPVTGDTSGAVW